MPIQKTRPKNHRSADERLNVLIKNIRKEQDAGRCLVLDLDILNLWPHIHISPFGVVDKGGADPAFFGRLIHDLSYPDRRSVNDYTDPLIVPKPSYLPPSIVASAIEDAGRSSSVAPELMSGDVAAAFRHCSIHSDSVHLFGGYIPSLNALVIDPSAPFGWTASPGAYELYGGAISYVHGSTISGPGCSPCFAYHWVDDHVCVATAEHEAVARSLRSAMITILGAEAINEDKFTEWATQLKVLGLQFDTVSSTVAMPPEKIANYRELLSCAHAAHYWGSTWATMASSLGRPCHIQFRIDNTSAVAWQSRMHSRNRRAQVLIRLLSAWEVRYNLRSAPFTSRARPTKLPISIHASHCHART